MSLSMIVVHSFTSGNILTDNPLCKRYSKSLILQEKMVVFLLNIFHNKSLF